jgi:hypothetical protein
MRWFIVFQLLLGVFNPLGSNAQTVHYDVKVGGRTIGSVKVLHFENKTGAEKRRIEADFSVPFYSGSFYSENQFHNGTLKSSLTEHRVNGKQKEKTATFSTIPQRYQIDFSTTSRKAEKSKDLVHSINHTITSLYYEEPLGLKAVYSERYGQMCSLEKAGAERYRISLPNGKQSLYIYRGGICQEVETELAGVKIRIVRKETRLAAR